MKNKNKISILMIGLILMILITEVASAVMISLNDYDPRPAKAGKTVNIWIKLDNPLNEPVEDISVELTPRDGLSLTTGEESRKKIGIIPARNSHIIQYRLFVSENAYTGPHTMLIRTFRGTSPDSGEVSLSLEVTDKDFKEVNLNIGSIKSEPTKIKPNDKNIKLNIAIQNLGDGNAQGVKAELVDLPEGISFTESYSGTYLLGNIASDSASYADFYIDVEESLIPKQYESYLKVSYKYKPEEDKSSYLFEEKLIPFTIAVKPVPLYEIISIELFPKELTAGDKDVQLKIGIKNIGEKKGEAVRVKIYGKTEDPFSYDESSDYVSPFLEPGEIGYGTFIFNIDKTAKLRPYDLDLEIKNIVDDEVMTYYKKVPVEVKYPVPDKPWKLYGIGIGALIIVLMILLINNIIDRRKKPKIKKVKGNYGKDYIKE